MSKVIMKFIANNPVSILFLGAILLIILGAYSNYDFTNFAIILLITGVLLQVIWIFRRR
jgi:hypothetical protein